MTEKQSYIYGLRLEGETEYRYVGSTTNPQHRFWQHKANAKDNPAKYKWIQENRESVVMDIFEIAKQDVLGVERRWVDALTTNGHRLFNERKPRRAIKSERDSALRYYMNQIDPDDGILREERPAYSV